MGKPGDDDSTQLLSESQVVAVTPQRPQPPVAPHDQSVAWKGTVVSADDFSLAPKKQASRAKWAVIGVLGAGVVGGGGVYLLSSSSPAPKPAPVVVAPPIPDAAPPPIDAAPLVDAPQDAAPPIDAGVPSDAAPAKPTTKSPIKKKPPIKKKKRR